MQCRCTINSLEISDIGVFEAKMILANYSSKVVRAKMIAQGVDWV